MERKVKAQKHKDTKAHAHTHTHAHAKAAEPKKKLVVPKRKIKKTAAAKPAVEVMGLHNLHIPSGAHQRKRILGRGPSSGHGKTSTRGSKGQTSRAGRDMYLGFEGGQTPLIRRIPKRGFVSTFRKEYQIVNLGDLKRAKAGEINPEALEKIGLIKDKNKLVKILGEGELKEALKVKAHAFSRSAQEKIKTAGGTFEVIEVILNV